MERHRRDEVEAKLRELARTRGPGDLTDALYYFSRELLSGGYPCEELYADFKNLISELRERGEEERRDAALEVMDVLVGWCAPSARL